MSNIHVEMWKSDLDLLNFWIGYLVDQNLYIQLLLSSENDEFEVWDRKQWNPRKIFKNPHQIFKILVEGCAPVKSLRVTPPELRERSIQSWHLNPIRVSEKYSIFCSKIDRIFLYKLQWGAWDKIENLF